MTNIDEIKLEFLELFGNLEQEIKRKGYLRNRPDAQANWHKFAQNFLGDIFFSQVNEKGIADTLISEPPRKLMAEGLQWIPETPNSLSNTEELIIIGVCRIRNNFFHGEKFVGEPSLDNWERDIVLVTEALAVLKLVSAKLNSDN